MRRASSASKRSAVRNQRRASRGPIARMTKGAITAGTMPSRTSLVANCALSAAMAMSQAATRPTPPPSAAPLTMAITASGTRRGAQHQLERARVGAVALLVVGRGALHPVEVGAGREALAGAGQHDGAHGGVLAQRLEGVRQVRDQRLVERVVELRPVQGDPGDRAVARDRTSASLIARLTSGTRRSASAGSAR